VLDIKKQQQYLGIGIEVKYYLSDLLLSHTRLKTAGYKFEMTKVHNPLSMVPGATALPGAPKFITIDGAGKCLEVQSQD